MINKGKVVLIGAGMVGAATLNALLMQNLFSDVAVIDLDRDRAEGEVLDAIRRCQVETLTPLEAMNLLYEWKQKLQ